MKTTEGAEPEYFYGEHRVVGGWDGTKGLSYRELGSLVGPARPVVRIPAGISVGKHLPPLPIGSEAIA